MYLACDPLLASKCLEALKDRGRILFRQHQQKGRSFGAGVSGLCDPCHQPSPVLLQLACRRTAPASLASPLDDTSAGLVCFGGKGTCQAVFGLLFMVNLLQQIRPSASHLTPDAPLRSRSNTFSDMVWMPSLPHGTFVQHVHTILPSKSGWK